MPTLSIEPNPNVTFKVCHEDAHCLVVSKPARIVTTPGLKHDRSSLLNGLFAQYGPRLQQLGRERDFGLLHRLDKMTSGLVIVALTRGAYDNLRAQFEQREVAKFYWAVVAQTPDPDQGMIRATIAEYEGYPRVKTRLAAKEAARDAKKPPMKLARISSKGEEASTAYRVLQSTPAAGSNSSVPGALLECRAYTGRLHQVRVHLAHIGCPIVGDDFYAPPSLADLAPRLGLHAHRLVFKHPATGSPIDVRTEWPNDLRAVLKKMGLGKPVA
jgi:23S rRNA pseudouridine1911/1915/1917 synthase